MTLEYKLRDGRTLRVCYDLKDCRYRVFAVRAVPVVRGRVSRIEYQKRAVALHGVTNGFENAADAIRALIAHVERRWLKSDSPYYRAKKECV